MISAKRILGHLYDLRVERECGRKRRLIRRRYNSRFDKPSRSVIREYREIWKPLTRNPREFYCSTFAEINGVVSPLYVPENVYYRRIEPVLNNRAFALAYADKNFYHRLVERDSMLPAVHLRGISGSLFKADLQPAGSGSAPLKELPVNTDLILKPATDSAGGEGVVTLSVNSNGSVNVSENEFSAEGFMEFLASAYRNNFVIQERIVQHEWFARYNSSSVNTVRAMIYRSPYGEVPHLLHSVVRFGRPGSLVDNQASGGFSCGVSNSGQVNDFAVDKYGHVLKLSNPDRSLPGFRELKRTALEISHSFPYQRLLGLDFAVASDGALKLLEVNTKNLEINFMQMNLSPLFGDHTEEVIGICSRDPRTIVLDFQL